MSAGHPGDPGSSGPLLARDDPRGEAVGRWNPRRSLGARLVLWVLPAAIVPALAYWLAADLAADRNETRLLETLVTEATRQEAQTLRVDANDREREIVDYADKLVAIVRSAAAETARALEAGPVPGRPPEELVDEAGGLVRTVRDGPSVAAVSRRVGLTARTRRDLAATQRLEAPFVSLALGPVDISAIAVRTASGVLRVVPGRPLRVRGANVVDPSFVFPSADLRAVAALPAPDGPAPVVWSAAYEDLFARAGSIVTAATVVRGRDGTPVAEVGVDWVFTRVFEGPPDPSRPDDFEVLVSESGALLLSSPPGRVPGAEAGALASVVLGNGVGDFESEVGGRDYRGSIRRIPTLRWYYATLSPRTRLEQRVRAKLDPILAAGRRQRIQIRLFFLAVTVALSAGLVAVTRRALEPVRRVADLADAIALGKEGERVPGLDRADEVGRLFRAMKNLERRMRWRRATMEGVNSLAQAAALMTRPEETLAELTRQIAQLVGATKAWLCLWDPETRSLVVMPPGYGVPDDVLTGARVGPDERSLTAYVYRTGETVVRNDTTDPRLSPTLVQRFGIRENIAFAPLKAEAGILGVLGVADKPGGFDAEDEAAIDGYAGQAALLLRNARLYEELQKSYERLRDAQRNRDYFLQNVNHELRTPLTAILGWSEVLAEDKPDKETVKIAVDQINRSAQFLLALISDLLDLSRFEEGRTRLEPEEVDLGPLVAGAVEPVAVMAEAKGISVTVATPPERTLVRLDPMRMRQVLWNLVHNAVKFTPKGGKIGVDAAADAAGVSFSVVDNGVGVDAKDLPFIFERFRQVDGSATRAYRGMGIGLALAKAYVELHGGTIAVESQPGKGTTFRVRIPRTASAGHSGAVRAIRF